MNESWQKRCNWVVSRHVSMTHIKHVVCTSREAVWCKNESSQVICNWVMSRHVTMSRDVHQTLACPPRQAVSCFILRHVWRCHATTCMNEWWRTSDTLLARLERRSWIMSRHIGICHVTSCINKSWRTSNTLLVRLERRGHKRMRHATSCMNISCHDMYEWVVTYWDTVFARLERRHHGSWINESCHDMYKWVMSRHVEIRHVTSCINELWRALCLPA